MELINLGRQLSRRRKTLISNLHYLVATSSHGEGFRSKPQGKNRRGAPKAVGLLTITSFWQLLQPSWCQMYCSALLWTTLVRPRGGFWWLGTPGSPHNLPRLAPWGGHSSVAVHSGQKNTGGSSYELQVQTNWHRLGCYGLSLMVRGIFIVPLVSYCMPQMGQPPVSKVLMHLSLSARCKLTNRL